MNYVKEFEQARTARAASDAVTPVGELPTADFTDTPATAKAVLRSPNPQGEVPTWEQMSVTERLMNGLEGGYHGLQKSRAATAAYEAEQAAQAGLSALVADDEDESVKELLSRDTQANRDYKEKQAAARDKAIYEYADLAKKDKEYVTPLAVQNASQKAKGKGFWSGLGTALTEMAADPLNSALYLGTSSLGAIAPYMALSAAGGGLLGAARLTSAARAVQMATMFKGSYDNELGNYLIKAMQEKGIDLQNPDAMRTALQADDMSETYEKGKKRAAVVGAFDAVAALAAPIRLNPSNAIRTVRDAAGILKASGLHGVDKVKSIPEAFGMARSATPTSRGGMWGYNLESHLTQAGLQGVLGGAGEALGSLAAGDEINWADVLFEAIGELTSAPVEVVSMTASVNAAYNAQHQQAQAAKVLGENMQRVTAAVAAMGTQVKDGQTIADWANDVGQDKSVFSFAQDLVDAGVPDKIRQAAPELAARIETAAQNKSDVAIPVSDVVKLAATDEAAANSILYESRVDADGMSPRQAEDFMKNGKQEAVAAFDKIVQDTKPDAEMRKAIDTEVDAIRKQLIDAGTAEDVADLQTRPWASWLAIRAKQTGLSPKEIMGKMNLRIRRQQSQTPAFQQQLSTAMPSEAAVKKGDYPNPRFARQWADFAEAKKNSRYFERAVAAMKTIPGVKGAVGRVRNAGKASERIIDFMADNLVWLYDKMPAAERERAKLWYDGGNKTARVWAQRYGLRLRQVAAVIAIFSPQNGWFNNMTNAERLFDIYFSARREKPSAEMQTALKTLCESDKKVGFDEIKGKSLEELIQADQMRGAALWVRAYDAVTNPSTYNVLTPEGGVGGLASVPGGQEKPAKAFFFNPQSIADALSVIVDGSVDNIYDKIGTQFKVRDFYNNLYDPSNAKAATIDTHAVGADTLTIQSSNSQPVQDNFGAVGNKTSGQNGTYPLHFEAYRRAAERVGLSPREIQSITWEAVRVLFEPNRKRVLRSVVDDIWKEFDAGKISADEARQKIFDAAGGLSKLSWQDTPFNDRITETYDRSGVTLYDDVRQPEPEPALTMEAAPDPNNAEAVAQWNELSPADKLAVTRKIVPWLLERVAEQTHTHIPELQRGGYLGDPNYSILCRIADGGDYVKVGRLLASYLRQDSVMAISQTNGEGMFSSKVIRIQLPDGFTEAQVDDLYRNHIDRIRDANGERLIMGQSTAGGVMMLSVGAENIEAIKAGLNSIVEGYGDQMVYRVSDAYTGFLEPYSEEEKTNARNDTGRSGGVRQETSAGYDADLQSETDKRLAQAIKAKIASRPRGFGQSGVYTAGTGGVRPVDERSAEGGVRGTRSPGESGQRFEGGIVRESDVPTTAEYGEKGRPNAVRVLGIHMSAVNRPSLNSRYYGTGLKGQELKRLTKTGPLSDVYSRIYFYLDTGKGIIPEEGVGREAHSIWLNNIYDLDEDPLGLLAKGRKESSNDDWAFTWTEHFIKAAGFDGYIVHHFGRGGAVCLLGDQHDNVRPQYQGRVQALNAVAVTSAQLGILENSSKGNYLALSYNTPEGRIVDDTEFDSASPEEIGTFFAEAEEKAALGIAGAYAQTAYHGSPFKFDRFTLDHIGAGAGTQQHGYGLYFAMNRKTAESYRDALAGGGEYTVNGKPVSRNIESTDMEDLAATWVLREMPGTQKHPKPAQVKRAAETAIKRLNEDTERGQVDKATSSKLRNELAKIYQQPKDYSIEYTPSTEGRVYRTDIPDSDVLLSEEAAMVDQPVVVRKALQKLAFDLVAEGMDDLDKGTTSPRADARNKVIELIGKDSAEGRDVYSWLTAYAGGSKEASELLNLYGIKGLEYFSEPDGNCAVIWDDTALKILNSLEQPEQSGTRGSMMPSNAGDVRPGEGGVMTLMESADKSTFLHESAHAWLDADTMLAQDIADKVLAGGELTDGEKAFLTNLGGFFRWGQQEGVLDLGVTDDLKTVATGVRTWAEMSINDQRGMHELFAEGFESYLLEGVSPNAEMKTIFGRFKKWLMDIYAQATRQPHPISPEVRKLYDLMFATEQQAMETQQKLGMRALFDGEIGKRLGMTDEELAAYTALNEEATQEAEGLVAKAVHGVLRIYGNIRRKEARRILRERRDEVNKRTDEILEEPRFRALSLLTHGLKNEDGTTSRMTIELKTLSRCGIDAETAQLLMDRGWVTEGRGVSPEVLANTAGTTDVVGLIGDLLELKSMNDAKTEAIKSVAYKVRIEGGMNPDAFDELQSNLAAHNETRSRFITAEFNALARALGKRQLMVSAAREYAVEQIGNMKLSDIRPGTFMNAERRCAAMAEQAMRKGDFGTCLEAKRGQVLNHEMARAALEALDRYQRGVRMAKRAMKSKTVHPAYKKLILALLDAHSVASMTAKEREDFGKLAADPAQLQELIKEVEDAGTPIEGLQRFIDSHEHAKDMTGYDSQDFFSVLKQLETLGRNVYNQNLAEELGRIDEIVKEGKEAIKEAADRQGRDVIENERVPFTRWERWRDNVHQFLLNHVKIQSWCRIFDQNQSGGFFWNLFIRSANERSTFENSMRAKVSKTLAEKLAPVFKKSQDEDPVIIPGFSKPFTHGQRIAVALNCGNDSNRQRLVDGDCRFTDDALQAIFSTLTEADWRAVEAVWQQFEELRPLIAEKEKRVFGTEPEWIDYQPFMVKTAEGKIIQVSGGYYPVKFDPRGSNRAAKYADANDVRQEMQGAYQSATTRRSFTKSRAQGDVHMPLRIDLAALYEGFNDVIHDLAWHEWLIETKRVLDGVNGRDSGLRQAIKERYGYLVAKQFEDWRKDIATGGRDSADSWVNRMTANVGVATMGFSVTSAFVQLTGIGYVIPRVGIAPVMTAVGKFISDPVGLHRAITKKSEAMRLRGLTQNREIAQVRNRLESGKHWFKDHAYVMMTIMQNIVDSIAWQAAYERYTREGNSEDKAIAMADQVVIDTQSSGNVSDLSAIERSQGARLFTVFYSWMNAALNMGVVEAMGENDRAKAAARLLFMGAVMPVLESLFREALQAHDSDDDDDEDWTKQWLRKPLGAVVEYHLGLFLGLREVSSTAKSLIAGEPLFGYNGPAGTRMIANTANAMQAATDPLSWRGLKVLVDIAGSLTGAPSTQINRTIKGVRAIESGQAEGVDAVLAPLFGFSGKIDE